MESWRLFEEDNQLTELRRTWILERLIQFSTFLGFFFFFLNWRRWSEEIGF